MLDELIEVIGDLSRRITLARNYFVLGIIEPNREYLEDELDELNLYREILSEAKEMYNKFRRCQGFTVANYENRLNQLLQDAESDTLISWRRKRKLREAESDLDRLSEYQTDYIALNDYISKGVDERLAPLFKKVENLNPMNIDILEKRDQIEAIREEIDSERDRTGRDYWW
jgi:hypothetical protein